jgi:uncharacterized protein with GYD domain
MYATKMPLFITYVSYSHSGVKGFVDKPADRSGAVKAAIEKAGGKLTALYHTTGSNDAVLVSEFADGQLPVRQERPIYDGRAMSASPPIATESLPSSK